MLGFSILIKINDHIARQHVERFLYLLESVLK